MRLKKFLERQCVWYGLVPAAMLVVYWFGLRSFAFTDRSWWRIPALPKVFFDQTMYLQVMAKDIVHGFHILPFPLRPFAWLAGRAWPAVTMSEFYVIGVILSAIMSLWLFSALIRHVGSFELGEARVRALIAFLLVHALLVLRPGGPSWYAPFFFASLLLVWLGEWEWDRRPARAIGAWVLAILLASVYPWYFATIVATCGLLFLARFIRPRHVLPIIGIGFVATGVAYAMREGISQAVTSSYGVLLAVYGGIGWSHLTTVSNTILLMLFWIAAWLGIRRGMGDAHAFRRSADVLLAAWTGQLVLWFQSFATGLSIVPDHFIYSVWILSALSWAVWPAVTKDARVSRRVTTAIGVASLAFIVYMLGKVAGGVYGWTLYPSLVIHVGSWMFLTLAMHEPHRPRLVTVALAIGIASFAWGALAVRAAAVERAAIDREMDGVRQWIFDQRPSTDLRWCSDVMAADYLFGATGHNVYPTFSEKHDPAPISAIQNRLIELAGFFDPKRAGELYVWDDMMLHDLEFPCRAFVPGIRAVNALPFTASTRRFITGCDQAWADAERARVIERIRERSVASMSPSSALCDRFVVRTRLQDSWRIPSSYPLLYQDATASVYGNR